LLDELDVDSLADGMEVSTFETGKITVNVGDNVTITDENDRVSTVVLPNVQATNGVIHAINMCYYLLLMNNHQFTTNKKKPGFPGFFFVCSIKLIF
jgi:hypothetical protein